MTGAHSSLQAGDRVGDYVVEADLGRGGMGRVYAVRHEPSGVVAAMKVIATERRHDRAGLERFSREIRAAKAVRHINVAHVLSDGQLEDGSPYLMMELLEGRGLDDVIRERAPLPIDEALDYFAQACAGVQAAHSLGIVHRDLKPANLFVTQRNGRPHIKVVDFGISKVPSLLDDRIGGGALTASGNLVGSPRYMAPEQLTNAQDADHRADIWALGVILFEMLTGQSPFPSSTAGEYLAKIVSVPPARLEPLRPDAPEDLGHILRTCLSRDPDDRFNTLAHLTSAIARMSRDPFGDGAARATRSGPASARGNAVLAPTVRQEQGREPPPGHPVEARPDVGDMVGNYVLEEALGKGGMGHVFAARHLDSGARVAIKLMLAQVAVDPTSVKRFAREARAAGALNHPNVARVFEHGTTDDGVPFLVMELLQGESLTELSKRRAPLPIVEAVDLVIQACRGVAAVHAEGIIHRDLKLANLFVTPSPAGPCVKVLDFGISKLRPATGDSTALTRTGSLLGSPQYMSPEQLIDSRNVDVTSDVWALGVTLYRLLTGKHAFGAANIGELIAKIHTARAPRLRDTRPDAPEGLERVILTCLEKRPEDRYPTVFALREALMPFSIAARDDEREALETSGIESGAPMSSGTGSDESRKVRSAPPSCALAVAPLPGTAEVRKGGLHLERSSPDGTWQTRQRLRTRARRPEALEGGRRTARAVAGGGERAESGGLCAPVRRVDVAAVVVGAAARAAGRRRWSDVGG